MALYHQPWPPCVVPAARLDLTCPIEEERTPNYSPERFYPIRLGQLLNGRYQVATKLGYGANSTVWLARDLNRWKWSTEKYVAIKVKATKSSKRRASAENETSVMSFTLVNLKPDNIMIRIEDPKMFEKDAIEEYNNPLPEKQLDDRTIYLSRNNYGPLTRSTGIIQLVDFDLSVRSTPGKLHCGAIQGEKYRAPEVILNSGYSYSADIWSLGVLLWDLLEKKSHFNPASLGDGTGYDALTHLAQITALLGHAPQDLLKKGRRSALFYQEHGELKDPSRIPSNFNLESPLTCMAGEERQRLVHFVKRMMTWRPEDRSTAKELLDDPWLYKDFPQD
ncbi:CMGC/SRPK protein kinase [Fusarium bulbicola]|nr:CMGC/SRPK protein kinase [Fusarium bulbicola]